MLTRIQAKQILADRGVFIPHLNAQQQNQVLDAVIDGYNQGYNEGYSGAVAHTPLFL